MQFRTFSLFCLEIGHSCTQKVSKSFSSEIKTIKKKVN